MICLPKMSKLVACANDDLDSPILLLSSLCPIVGYRLGVAVAGYSNAFLGERAASLSHEPVFDRLSSPQRERLVKGTARICVAADVVSVTVDLDYEAAADRQRAGKLFQYI